MQQSQEKLFYGWVIVFAGLFLTLIMFGIVDAFGVMFKSISEQFHWDRGTISVASMINWICFGLGNLACGVLTDRFGSRRLLIVGGIFFIIGTILMSQIQSLVHLYFAFGVVMAIGRSAAAVPLAALITKWFTRNQGLALAISQSQNVGPAVFAPLTVFLLAQTDWRSAYLWLGVGSLLIIPLALLIRDYSEEEHGKQPVSGPAGVAPRAQEVHLTLNEAMRTRAFWTLNLMVLGCCICHSCILLHGFNHMTDMGLMGSTASRVAAVMALSGMVGKIACGILADRIGGKWAIALFLGVQAVMVPPFIHAHDPSSFYLWAVAFGIGYGGPMPVVYVMLFREYFGTRSIGSILGVFFVIAAVGMGSGGFMGGKLYDLFGSYAIPFLTSTGTGLISAFLALTLPSTKKPEQEVTAPQVVLQAS
jgi:MFS family permease